MNTDRAILIAFLGNYLVNTVAAALVALIPVSTTGGVLTAQYVSFVVFAAVIVAVLAWWCGVKSVRSGVIFGLVGFVTAVVVAFISGVAGVLSQTGSFSAVIGILPNFWPFLANWSTLVLLGYWVIPALLVGWYFGRNRMPAPMM